MDSSHSAHHFERRQGAMVSTKTEEKENNDDMLVRWNLLRANFAATLYHLTPQHGCQREILRTN